MSTSATSSADQSGFSVVRMPLRRVSDDSSTSGADKGASQPDRIASVPDHVRAGALDQSADRASDDQARLAKPLQGASLQGASLQAASLQATSLPAATEGDAELERLRKCLWALHEEIETLPRATQLPPIPGLPLLDASMTPSAPGAIDPATRIPTLSRQRPRRALSAFRLFLIAGAVAVPIGGYYGAGSFARLVDEFDTAALSSIDAQRVALLHLPGAVRGPRATENIPSGSEAERALEALRPTTGLENKPAEDGASSSQPPQGAEAMPRAGEPGITAPPVDEAPSQSDAAIVLDPEEIKPLIDRGRQFFDAGDVAAARLLFNRAAIAGDVTASVAMGTTYDPAVLGSRGVRGILADPQKARSWYEKAAELGSAEGLRLLKALDDGDGRPAAIRQTAEQVDSGGTPAPFAVNRDQGRAAPRELLMRRQPPQYSKSKH
jgi:hypothetical protein